MEKVKVLYIDDEDEMLDLVRSFMEMGGEFIVDTEKEPHNALDRLSKSSYDAIISDYQMSSMNGIELLEEIRSNSDDIPFILFTGKGREEIVIEALNRGADGYVQKGIDTSAQFAELIHQVKVAVIHHRDSEKLKLRDAKYHTTFENTLATIVIYKVIRDDDGQVIDLIFDDLNSFAAMRLDGAKEEFIGKKRSELRGSDNEKEILENVRGAIATMQPKCAQMFSELEKRHYISLFSPLDNDHVLRISIDITAQIEAQDQTLKSRNMLEVLTETVTDLIYMKDKDGRFILANPAMLQVIGKKADEVTGRMDREIPDKENILLSITNRDKNVLMSGLQEVAEIRLDTSSGPRTFISSKMPLLDASGTVIGVVNASRDITERKEIEVQQETALEFLRLMNESKNTDHLMNCAADVIMRRTGCEAIAIRISDDHRFPYYLLKGYPDSFSINREHLCCQNEQGWPVAMVDDPPNNTPKIICLCENVISGTAKSIWDNSTEYGSFWTNDMSKASLEV